MDNIRQYEAMAKIRLTDDERRWAESRADALLNSFDALSAVDTSAVQPLVTVLSLDSVLREDRAVRLVTREDLLSGAPEQVDGYFQVPRTLE